MNQNLALISIVVYAGNGEVLLKEIVHQFSQYLKINTISSIYRVQREEINFQDIHKINSADTFDGLSVVLKIATPLKASELIQFVERVQKMVTNKDLKQSVKLKLLVFNSETQMTPHTTLPDPDFHKKPEEIVPAAEIWGRYNHPILNQSMELLCKRFDGENWGTFFAQGRTLLDSN